MRHCIVGCLFAVLTATTGMATPRIVPRPVSYRPNSGAFQMNAQTCIAYTAGGRREAELTAAALRPATGFDLPVEKVADPDGVSNAIVFVSSRDPSLGTEGYQLEVSGQRITIAAPSERGWFYGFQTLRQLLPPEIFGGKPYQAAWTVDGCSITDEPSFPWRGMMLDVSRYWFTKAFMFRYLDIMAAHKLNVLHWHLIDDAGWRIEIRAYPKLTEVGAFRGEGNDRYGGYYTQADIREIVRYAEDRGITIVPEVEIPAHNLAAVAAYPELCCTGKQITMPTRHFISEELYCAGKDTTWQFLETVFGEVCDLFPGAYVHIGGDEARYTRWKACPDCQRTMKEHGLSSEKELQGWMTTRVEKFLAARGKRIIGWDEILHCGVSNQAGIMTWHQPETAEEGARQGNPVVMALTGHCYFDTVESRHPGEPPGATWLDPISLQKAYAWHPVPSTLTGDAVTNILGGNGCVWSDQFLHQPDILPDRKGDGTARSEAYVEYLSLPRMAALAEVTWTPRELRDWREFTTRMSGMYPRYSRAGWNYRLPLPEMTETRLPGGRTRVDISCPVEGGSIRYTTDGSEPTPDAPLWEGPIEVTDPAAVRAIAIAPGGAPVSLPTGQVSAAPG